jgi:hypothetical protein
VAAILRLSRATESQLRDLRAAAFVARIPAGRDVFLEGARVDAILLLLHGPPGHADAGSGRAAIPSASRSLRAASAPGDTDRALRP